MTHTIFQDSDIKIKNFKLLVAGYINVNVIDGSAFFLSGLVGMCARIPTIATTLITANPVRKTEVLDEILHYSNVRVVDPYIDTRIQAQRFAPSGDSMPRSTYAQIIGNEFIQGQFDALLVRDTETGYNLVKQYPEIAPEVSVYITGVTSLDANPGVELISQIRSIVSSGAKIVSQTPAMADSIAELKVGISRSDIFVLPPHVPDANGTFEEVFNIGDTPSRLAYTGKFFKAWNADKILAAYKDVKATENPDLTLEVAGDQFRNDPADTYFVSNVRYLLNSSDGLAWHGRVPRAVSRAIIERSHIGISWRAPELDASSELSTKILEYGAMGRPSILNRNPLHEELLGEDYPLFANSMTEFKNLLAHLGKMGAQVEVAAQRCYELSRSHWYSTVLPDLTEHLGNAPNKTADFSIPLQDLSLAAIPKNILHKKASGTIDGSWFQVVLDTDARSTVAEIATIAKFQLDSWEHLSKRQKTLAEHSHLNSESPQLSGPKITAAPAPSKDGQGGSSEPAVSPEQDSVLKRLSLAEQTNAELTEELRQLREKIDVLKGLRKRLETSRYGKIPLKVARKIKRKLL